VVWAATRTAAGTFLAGGVAQALFLAGCVVLTVLLCSAPVRKVARPVVQPRVDWLLVRPRTRAHARAR
jgi:predicted small integral membrane protein